MNEVSRAWARHDTPQVRVVTGQGQSWVIYAGSEAALKLLEAAPAARYVPREALSLGPGAPTVATWLLLPATATSFRLLELVGKVAEADDAYLALRQEMLGRCEEFAHLYPPTPEGYPAPYPHQVECFSECLRVRAAGAGGFGCFMEQGTGKTRLVTDLMRHLKPRVALVLYQKITLHQWLCCLENIFPEARVETLIGPVKGRAARLREIARAPSDGTTVLLLNYDVLYKLTAEIGLISCLDLVVADEATRVRHRTSQVSKAARKIARKAKFRISMTGTPLGSDPGDLWALFDFQDPKVFNQSYWNWMRRYCKLGGFTGWEFIGLREEHLPELIDRMYSQSYRATKATVTEMPPITYQVVDLTMGAVQRRHYDAVAKEYATEVELENGNRGRLEVTSALAQTTRLMQIAAGVLPLTSVEGDEGTEEHKTLPIPSVKTQWAAEYAKEIIETTDSRGVIWTMFQAEANQVCIALGNAGVEAAIIDGRTRDKDRARILADYGNPDGTLRWLVINVAAGAYGLDLPVADVLIYHSSSYNILDRMQSESRGHRIGRSLSRPYLILDLVIKGTIDTQILEARKRRMNLIELLVSQGTMTGSRASISSS